MEPDASKGSGCFSRGVGGFLDALDVLLRNRWLGNMHRPRCWNVTTNKATTTGRGFVQRYVP